jgi:hypothetical protein
MTEEQVRSLFTLACIPFTRLYELPNGYWGKNHELDRLRYGLENIINGLRNGRANVELGPYITVIGAEVKTDSSSVADRLQQLLESTTYHPDPWWLVRTPAGLVQIGWRKRVINIDWSDTDVRTVVTSDDVTKTETYVHAWSEAKALEYLSAFWLTAQQRSEPI